MSEILLISSNRMKNPRVFPLGMAYIYSGLLANDLTSVEMLDLSQIEYSRAALLAIMEACNPVFVGISMRNLDNCCYSNSSEKITEVQELIAWLRMADPKCTIIAGGSAVSIAGESLVQCLGADFGIIGDGERSFPELIHCLRQRRDYRHIPGLIYKTAAGFTRNKIITGSVSQLVPSREGFIHEYDHRGIRHNILSKKGCNQACIYCAYPYLEGQRLRLRNPDEVVDEMIYLIDKYKVDEFDFVDSVFNNPKEHAIDLCKAIIKRKIGVKWTCFMLPVGCDQDFLRLLKAAGCVHVEFGVDSASKAMLKVLRKNFRQADIKEAILNSQKIDLPHNVCLIIGGPNETMETVRESLDYLSDLNVDELFGLIGLRILPHTALNNLYCHNLAEKELLYPKFYLNPEIDLKEVKREFQDKYKSKHKNWMMV